MATATVRNSQGTTIVFTTSTFSSSVVGAKWSGIKRKAIDVSHFGVADAGANKFGNQLFTPGKLVDPGELELNLHFDPDKNPPIGAAAETVTVTFPKALSTDATAPNWAGTGFMTEYEVDEVLDDIIKATCKVKMSGEVTMTDEAA